MSCCVRGRFLFVLLALALAPAVASSTSFTSGSGSSLNAPFSGFLNSALDSSSASFRGSTGNWLVVRVVPTRDRLAPLEYVVLASRERLRVDLDLNSTVEWARKSAEQLRLNGPRFSGGSPTGSNPLPEPTAALLFGAGLTAFAASRRSRRR